MKLSIQSLIALLLFSLMAGAQEAQNSEDFFPSPYDKTIVIDGHAVADIYEKDSAVTVVVNGLQVQSLSQILSALKQALHYDDSITDLSQLGAALADTRKTPMSVNIILEYANMMESAVGTPAMQSLLDVLNGAQEQNSGIFILYLE